MNAPEIIEIRDSFQTAGTPTYYRVVPSNGGQDPQLLLMESTAGSTGTAGSTDTTPAPRGRSARKPSPHR